VAYLRHEQLLQISHSHVNFRVNKVFSIKEMKALSFFRVLEEFFSIVYWLHAGFRSHDGTTCVCEVYTTIDRHNLFSFEQKYIRGAKDCGMSVVRN